MMRFKLDENLPNSATDVVEAAGYEAETAAQESLEGSADAEIFSACQRESRVLVTLDLDFAEIRAYPSGTHVDWRADPQICSGKPHELSGPQPRWQSAFLQKILRPPTQ